MSVWTHNSKEFNIGQKSCKHFKVYLQTVIKATYLWKLSVCVTLKLSILLKTGLVL